MKKFEKTVKEKIQSIENEIPEIVESRFLRSLDQVVPIRPLKKPKSIFRYRFAAVAAMLLLVVLYLLFPLFTKKSNLQITRDILVQSVKFEGKPAETYIFREKDPDLTIIWIDKNGKGAI